MLSFRRRLILIHLAVIAAILTCSGFGAYWLLSRTVHNQLDAALLAVAETEAAILKASQNQPVRIHDAAAGSTQLSFARIDRLVQIVDAGGEVLVRSANLGSTSLPTPQGLLLRLAKGETVFETLDNFGDEPVRMVSLPINGVNSPMTVQVAGSTDDVSNVLNAASLLFISMTIGLLAAVALVGTSLTRKVFNAIENVVRQAGRIGEANLDERLPHPGTNDEIGQLVDTLNEMLDRLQRSFQVQQRFTADASHELRSPLSRLRTELEVTLRRPRDLPEYMETLRSCLEEVQRLTLIIEELLLLARYDAGLERDAEDNLEVNLIVEEVVNRFQPVAKSRDIQIIFAPPPPVHAKIASGSMNLVLTNLFDNALKFSPAGGSVTLRLAVEESEVVLSISDTGPGVNYHEQSQLFERFYRGSVAQTNNIAGVGLGLAISQAVVRSHGGVIQVENLAAGGAMFTVRLPLTTFTHRTAKIKRAPG